MGSYSDACMEAFKQQTGVREASGAVAVALNGLQCAAFDLIKTVELEKSGIRGGDGSWGPSDVLYYAVQNVKEAHEKIDEARAIAASVRPGKPTTEGGRSLASTYFGVCPKSGDCDGYLNIGPRHWFYSLTGKTKWHFGSYLFSSWEHEGSEIWNHNRAFLADFKEVEPVVHEPVDDDLQLPKPNRRPWEKAA